MFIFQPLCGVPKFFVRFKGGSTNPSNTVISGEFAKQMQGGPRKTKTALLGMKYWLFKRDPYSGLLKSLYNWAVYTRNNQVFFIAQANLGEQIIVKLASLSKVSECTLVFSLGTTSI